MKRQQLNDDADIRLDPATIPADGLAGRATEPGPTVPIEDMQVARRKLTRDALRPEDVDGNYTLDTPEGRAMILRAMNSPADGLKQLLDPVTHRPLVPGQSVDVMVDSWVSVWSTDLERGTDGEIEAGWAITLFLGGQPVLGWASPATSRQWANLMSFLATTGPWAPPITVRVTCAQSRDPGRGPWYSLSLP